MGGTSPQAGGDRNRSVAERAEGRNGRVLVMLALVVYLPAFSGGFVWDDWILVTEPLVRRLDGVVSIWLSPSLERLAYLFPETPGLVAGLFPFGMAVARPSRCTRKTGIV